jgi:hypothetical protein
MCASCMHACVVCIHAKNKDCVNCVFMYASMKKTVCVCTVFMYLRVCMHEKQDMFVVYFMYSFINNMICLSCREAWMQHLYMRACAARQGCYWIHSCMQKISTYVVAAARVHLHMHACTARQWCCWIHSRMHSQCCQLGSAAGRQALCVVVTSIRA